MIDDKEIDPFNQEYCEKTLWCVYGANSFPTIFCCKINTQFVIWGYSVYRRSPGFRTLGMELKKFVNSYQNVKFFAEQSHALHYLEKLTKPRKIKEDPYE